MHLSDTESPLRVVIRKHWCWKKKCKKRTYLAKWRYNSVKSIGFYSLWNKIKPLILSENINLKKCHDANKKAAKFPESLLLKKNFIKFLDKKMKSVVANI